MIANVADLHPQYHENVHVREASPYDQSIFTRFRYVLFAVGGDISWEKEMRAKVEAEYYRNKMEYNLGVEQGYAEAYDSYMTEVGNGLVEFGSAYDQEMNNINNFNASMDQEINSINNQSFITEDAWNEGSAGSQLWQMLMGGN